MARTIGKRKIQAVKNMARKVWEKRGLDIEHAIGQLPAGYWDTWEMADQEIRRIVSDEMFRLEAQRPF